MKNSHRIKQKIIVSWCIYISLALTGKVNGYSRSISNLLKLLFMKSGELLDYTRSSNNAWLNAYVCKVNHALYRIELYERNIDFTKKGQNCWHQLYKMNNWCSYVTLLMVMSFDLNILHVIHFLKTLLVKFLFYNMQNACLQLEFVLLKCNTIFCENQQKLGQLSND